MPPSKKSTDFDVFSKTREELSRTADSFIMLLPGSKRNTPENIANGEEEYLPDPSRPVRFFVSQGREKFFLSTADLKCIIDLYQENKPYIDASFDQVGRRAKEKAEAMAKLFQE